MKKLLSVVLSVLMLASVFTLCLDATTYVDDDTFTVGDVDSSDKIDAQDLLIIKAYLIGSDYALEKLDSQASDIAADGNINSSDAFNLKTLLVGKNAPSDFENGHQLYRFTIAGTDIQEFTIELPDFTSTETNAYLTATILQQYVKEATGFELPISLGATETAHKISIHEIPRFSEEGEIYENENYKYEVVDGNLHLYGTYRGNMYAAYEIIEKYLGFRFFDGEYIFLYKNRYIDIPEGTSVFFKPALKMRRTGQNTGNLFNYSLPAHMNGTRNSPATDDLKHGTFYGYQFCNAHSFDLYWRMGTGTRPAEDDPNYPELQDRYNQQYESGFQQNGYGWQPCATSDEQYELMFGGMLDTIARMESWVGFAWHYNFKNDDGTMTDYVRSGQASMSFSLCDNEKYCTCRYCKNKANGWTDRSVKPPVKHDPEGWSGTYVDLANRAARDLQEYYPGLRVHTILYNHAIPATVRPDKNLIVYYCGQGCNNHILGSTECGDCPGQLGRPNNNQLTNESLKAWGQFCVEAGAEMWFWYYGVQYAYILCDLPNVINIYYDYKYLYDVCSIDGINYEGGGSNYNYATLKAYLSTRMEWKPDMTLDEFIGHYKEYLYMYYGDGYEKVYEFIEMQTTAGDLCGTCFISNFDRPGDMYSYDYIAENYEYMRQLLIDAYELADRPEYKQHLKTMMICFEFLGLSSVHQSWYVEGDAKSKALYEERYTEFYRDFKASGMRVYSDGSTYVFPAEIDFTVNPMVQIYENGSNRPNIYP